jgi:hypothetical protein
MPYVSTQWVGVASPRLLKLHEYQNKGVAGKAIHKSLKTKGQGMGHFLRLHSLKVGKWYKGLRALRNEPGDKPELSTEERIACWHHAAN